jgi:hypothetical protein
MQKFPPVASPATNLQYLDKALPLLTYNLLFLDKDMAVLEA